MNKAQEQRRRLDSLRAIDLFAECTETELAAIDVLGTEVTVRPGSRLTREGRAGLEFFVVHDGRGTICAGRRPVTSVGPGSFFGEVSLLSDVLRTATVTAESPMRLTVFNHTEFGLLLAIAPTVREKVQRAAAARAGVAGRLVSVTARSIGRGLDRRLAEPA